MCRVWKDYSGKSWYEANDDLSVFASSKLNSYFQQLAHGVQNIPKIFFVRLKKRQIPKTRILDSASHIRRYEVVQRTILANCYECATTYDEFSVIDSPLGLESLTCQDSEIRDEIRVQLMEPSDFGVCVLHCHATVSPNVNMNLFWLI